MAGLAMAVRVCLGGSPALPGLPLRGLFLLGCRCGSFNVTRTIG